MSPSASTNSSSLQQDDLMEISKDDVYRASKIFFKRQRQYVQMLTNNSSPGGSCSSSESLGKTAHHQQQHQQQPQKSNKANLDDIGLPIVDMNNVIRHQKSLSSSSTTSSPFNLKNNNKADQCLRKTALTNKSTASLNYNMLGRTDELKKSSSSSSSSGGGGDNGNNNAQGSNMSNRATATKKLAQSDQNLRAIQSTININSLKVQTFRRVRPPASKMIAAQNAAAAASNDGADNAQPPKAAENKNTRNECSLPVVGRDDNNPLTISSKAATTPNQSSSLPFALTSTNTMTTSTPATTASASSLGSSSSAPYYYYDLLSEEQKIALRQKLGDGCSTLPPLLSRSTVNNARHLGMTTLTSRKELKTPSNSSVDGKVDIGKEIDRTMTPANKVGEAIDDDSYQPIYENCEQSKKSDIKDICVITENDSQSDQDDELSTDSLGNVVLYSSTLVW